MIDRQLGRVAKPEWAEEAGWKSRVVGAESPEVGVEFLEVGGELEA